MCVMHFKHTYAVITVHCLRRLQLTHIGWGIVNQNDTDFHKYSSKSEQTKWWMSDNGLCIITFLIPFLHWRPLSLIHHPTFRYKVFAVNTEIFIREIWMSRRSLSTSATSSYESTTTSPTSWIWDSLGRGFMARQATGSEKLLLPVNNMLSFESSTMSGTRCTRCWSK